VQSSRGVVPTTLTASLVGPTSATRSSGECLAVGLAMGPRVLSGVHLWPPAGRLWPRISQGRLHCLAVSPDDVRRRRAGTWTSAGAAPGCASCWPPQSGRVAPVRTPALESRVPEARSLRHERTRRHAERRVTASRPTRISEKTAAGSTLGRQTTEQRRRRRQPVVPLLADTHSHEAVLASDACAITNASRDPRVSTYLLVANAGALVGSCHTATTDEEQ
jgi:hypothetical protein